MMTRSSIIPSQESISTMSSSVNDILLHPDALHCLKRKQLENLCMRLDIKSTGKKDELVARLEGYSSARAAQAGSPSRGQIVTARPRARTSSRVSYASTSGKEPIFNDEEDEDGIPNAGPSIRLITKGEENEDGVGQVSRSSSGRFILGEKSVNEEESTTSIQPSTSTKTIYPWKRISSSSSQRTTRSASSTFTLTSLAAPVPEDDPMTLDEFGAAKEKDDAISSKGSLKSLKRWLSISSVKSDSSKEREKFKEVSAAPSETRLPTVTSPASKRKREEEEESESGGMPGAFSTFDTPSPEKPVKRVIKSRPSRAVKQTKSSPSTSTIPNPLPISATPVEPSDAATKVWEEMNARLKQSGKASMVQLPSQNGWSVSSGIKPPASPLKSMNSRTKGRFSNEHEKHFGQMDSIASHYAAKREKENPRAAQADSEEAGTSKRIKITEEKPKMEKSAEERAAIHRKLEMSRQRRKSVGRKGTSGRKSGVTSSSKVGFKSKFSGAVRDLVGAARDAVKGGEASRSDVTRQNKASELVQPLSRLPVITPLDKLAVPAPAPAPAPTSSASSSVPTPKTLHHSKSRPTFDLQASLARKPTGYTPYSAKETVQTIQNAAIVSASPSKAQLGAATAAASVAPSPIRTGWTMISSAPINRPTNRSTSSTIAFPSVSPLKDQSQKTPSASPLVTKEKVVEAESPMPPTIRRNTLQTHVPVKKTRSSLANTHRGTMNGDRLKRAAKANEVKHQAAMAAKRRTGDAVQRAVARGEQVASAAIQSGMILSGSGRGSPRKASGKIVMEGEGRGAAGMK